MHKSFLQLSLVLLGFLPTLCSEPLCKKSSPEKADIITIEINYAQKEISQDDETLFMSFFSGEEKDLKDLNTTATFCSENKCLDTKAYKSNLEVLTRVFIQSVNDGQISDNQLAALALIQKTDSAPHTLSLHYLCVAEKFQNHRIGKLLLKSFIERYQQEIIEVNPFSSAVYFYKANGFEDIGGNILQKTISKHK